MSQSYTKRAWLYKAKPQIFADRIIRPGVHAIRSSTTDWCMQKHCSLASILIYSRVLRIYYFMLKFRESKKKRSYWISNKETHSVLGFAKISSGAHSFPSRDFSTSGHDPIISHITTYYGSRFPQSLAQRADRYRFQFKIKAAISKSEVRD